MLERHISLQLEIRDDGKKTVEASLSSETPILRPGLGREILVHTSAAVDLSRAPLPLLTSHNRDETPVGIIENIRISSGKLRATLRFGNSQRALEAWEDVKAGVLRSISIGYQILKGESRGEDYVVTSWMPFEASLVSVPADPTVGIGRSYQGNQIMETQTQNEVSLSRTQRKAATRTAQETTEALNDIYAIGQQFKVGTEKTRNFIDEHGADSHGFRAFVLTSL
ncbi:MAG: HK97 family phage prohead protease [Nitrosomonas ureae]